MKFILPFFILPDDKKRPELFGFVHRLRQSGGLSTFDKAAEGDERGEREGHIKVMLASSLRRHSPFSMPSLDTKSLLDMLS